MLPWRCGGKEQFATIGSGLWPVSTRWKGRHQHGASAHIGGDDFFSIATIDRVSPEFNIGAHATTAGELRNVDGLTVSRPARRNQLTITAPAKLF